jgi:MOSC domain-containing protein YiiM
MASVLHLFRAPQRRLEMEEVVQAVALEDFGFEGCAHARRESKRQLLLMDSETLAAMELRPGIVRENITTSGLNVNGLQPGQLLQIGEARVAVSMPCTPCDQMEKIRPGLRKELRGRRGVLCRVVSGGVIRRGDSIDKISDEKVTSDRAVAAER